MTLLKQRDVINLYYVTMKLPVLNFGNFYLVYSYINFRQLCAGVKVKSRLNSITRLVDFSTCQNVLGQDSEGQITPDVQAHTLHCYHSFTLNE